MSAPLSFGLGFLLALVLCFTLAALYYARARRRVKLIEKAIHHYHEATKTVNEALDHTYANPKRIVPSKRQSG